MLYQSIKFVVLAYDQSMNRLINHFNGHFFKGIGRLRACGEILRMHRPTKPNHPLAAKMLRIDERRAASGSVRRGDDFVGDASVGALHETGNRPPSRHRPQIRPRKILGHSSGRPSRFQAQVGI